MPKERLSKEEKKQVRRNQFVFSNGMKELFSSHAESLQDPFTPKDCKLIF